jgi:predicted RNase H-like nuclease (RuvC/YqgF family)
MKAKIAVATISGKAYYLIVSVLKRKGISFLSLAPDETVPIGVLAVITTEQEQQLINHDKILVYREGMDAEVLVNDVLRVVQGKEYYDRVIIGIDPGEVFGLAVLADGKVIETENCFSINDTVGKVKSTLESLGRTPIGSISVKIGDGVPACKEKLLRALDAALSKDVMLESVSEAGTNRGFSEAKHRRGLRDIVSAIKIAGRNGQKYMRRKTDGYDG